MKYRFLLLLLLIFVSAFSQNKNQSIGFKENKGQIIDQKGKANPAVKYLLNSSGLNVQLKKNGFSYDVYETKKHPIRHSIKEKRSSYINKEKTPDYTLEYFFHRIDIDFVNSNTSVELVTAEASKDYDNYYNVPNKPEGVVNVHQYQQITYKNIYPNIDVVFSIPKDTLKTVEYNFVVHPKGKISDIQMKFNGAKTELVDNKIRMNVRFGEMEETLPASWTEDGISKKSISVAYTKIKKDVYGFQSKENISDKTVIIDPVPVRLWGTYYGGSEMENQFESLVKVHNKNVFIGGYTESTSDIATTGAFQTIFSFGILDGYISKFDANGQRIWGTYYGGDGRDAFRSLDVDSQGNIYAVGEALISNNLATPNSFQNTNNGWYDGIIVKFDENGQRIWATYFGGDAVDFILDVKVDKNQDIIICGYTSSFSGISTLGSFHSLKYNTSTNSEDGFLSKFSKDGNRIWSTYYEGDIISVDVDSNNNIFISGNISNGAKDIATNGAYDETFAYNTNTGVSFYNTFFAKFTTDGNRMFGSYFGGIDTTINKCIKVDKEDNFLITGMTDSSYGLTMINSFQPINAGRNDIYLAKFTNNGTIIWNTFYGGTGDEGSNDLEIDEENNIYLLGNGDSQNNISTSNSYQESLNGYWDLYLIKFSPQGKRIWGTYYGGTLGDTAGQISFEGNGIFYISGSTNSLNNISSSNAFQINLNGAFDSFLVKFKDCISSTTATSNSPICVGKTLELKASGGTNYSWTGPNGFTSTLQNPTILNATVLNNGQYSCSITVTGGCDDTKTVDIIVGDIESPIPDLATLPIIIGDCNTVITIIPTATDSCAGAITATTTNPLSYRLHGSYTVVWNYTDGNGNTSTQNQTITINIQPLPSATSPQNFCIQQNATLNEISITGQNIKWYDALTNGTLLLNTTSLQNGTTYYASQTINSCESEKIAVLINIQNTPAPTGSISQTFCSSQNPTLDTIIISGTAIKWYNRTGVLLSNSTPLQDGETYYASQTENNCESKTKLAITVSLINTLPANNYIELFCDDLNDGSEKVNLSDYNSKLISNVSGYNFYYYSTFSGAENQLAANQITIFSNYNLVLGDNKIYVRINSNTPCYAIVELELTLLSKPKITIQDVVPICENNTITIDAGSGFDTYLWSNGATTSSIIVTNPGNYSVTVTNNYSTISCSSTKNFEVRKSNIATITSIDKQDWTDNQNTIIVYVTGAGDFEYSIDGIHFQDSNQFSNIISGQYTVYVRDKNGCGSTTDEVYLLMYPKFFTPNGDGSNDTWKIKFSDIEESLTVKIFDRYGKLIIELQNNIGSWDGTFNDQELPASDYWFVVTRADGTEYRGHFSLKR